jgi:holo-[acyl-carrier protein] synthase
MDDSTRLTSGQGQVRVGIDMADVATVRDALDRFGERYRHRVYTPGEIDYCTHLTSLSCEAERFAARFAAKEAVTKLLQPDGDHVAWRSIEVLRHDTGRCSVVLRDSAADLAARAGITDISLSLSHEGGLAVAIAAALITGEPNHAH